MRSQNWIHRYITIFAISFGLTACAGYPGEPRNPEPGDDRYEIEEDGFLSVSADKGILANDKPKEGTESILLTTGELQTDQGGVVILAEDGSFTYEPGHNFNGTDQLAYTIGNSKSKNGDGVIYFTVTPTNDPPEPVNDHMEIIGARNVSIDVLANDIEPDGDPLQVVDVGEPNIGAVAIGSNNAVDYAPRPTHNGDVGFTYTVADSGGERATAWVLLTFEVENGIDLQPDTITVMEDSSTTVPVSQLLANDTGDGLTLLSLTQAQNGTVVRNGQTFTYIPNPDFSGEDSFIYTVQARDGNTAGATVTVSVAGLFDPPTISPIDDQTTVAGVMTGPIAFIVEDLDTPVEELSITAVVSDAVPAGLVSQENITITGSGANRAIRILPTGNLTGQATITITVSDGQAESSESFVLTVSSAIDAPNISVIVDHSTLQNTPLTINFTINDNQTLPVHLIVTATSSNQVLVPDANLALGGNRSNRSITITPAPGQLGITTITVSVSDGTNVNSRTFQVEVYAPGDEPDIDDSAGAPVISNIADQSTPRNSTLTVDFSLDDVDDYPVNLTVTATSSNDILVPDANLQITGDRSARTLIITPVADRTGTTTITISADDGDTVTTRSFELEVY